MRTTLSLDEDVSKLLRREMRRTGASFKSAVNHYLRLGLERAERPKPQPFVVKPVAMGLPPGLSYENIAELIEALEGPLHK